jgi:hypothetical protein
MAFSGRRGHRRHRVRGCRMKDQTTGYVVILIVAIIEMIRHIYSTF